MAVEDKYGLSDLESEKRGNAAFLGLGNLVGGTGIIEVAAADDDGSVYRIFTGLSGALVPLFGWVNNDAITGGTDYDLGFYESRRSGTSDVGGAVVDADKLIDGANLSNANALGSELVMLGGAGSQYDMSEGQEKIYQLAGQTVTTKKRSYDIAWTANTVGSAAGTIVLKGIFIQG